MPSSTQSRPNWKRSSLVAGSSGSMPVSISRTIRGSCPGIRQVHAGRCRDTAAVRRWSARNQALHVKCILGTVRCMSTRTVGFAVAEEDVARLERLTRKFGQGNRSAFLREAMKQMEVIDRAERLAELQAYGAERSAAAGLDTDEALAVVRRVLKRR